MNEKPLPGHDKQPDDIICSSCGRFVGPQSRCPHCGARVHKRMSVRFFRVAAVLLATVGIGLLYWMSVMKPIPLVQVEDIVPTMNFAYIQVEGEVCRDVRVYQEGDTVTGLRFDVDDGTGEIPVKAYQKQAQELVASDRLPRRGDRVVVAGSLSVAAGDQARLILQVPDQLHVDRSERRVVPVADIDESLVGQTILVQGVLTSVRAPRPGSKAPWGLVLSEGDDQIRVTFWDSLYEALQDKTRLTPGQSVRLYAAVTTYKGDVQLKLNQARDLEYLSEELPSGAIAGAGVPHEAEVLMLEEISAEHKGQTVETEGQVVRVFEPKKDSKAPYKVILEDGNGKVAVVYWDKVAKELNGRKPVEGARMQVRGKVDQYKDEIQVKVQYADQMTLLALPDKARPERPKDTTPVADITMAMTGTPVVISGRLSEPKSLPGGVIYTLKDDSGKMPLVLWDRFIPGEEREELQGGKSVTVRGEVGTYKGKLQVVPRDPAELWIHSRGGAN